MSEPKRITLTPYQPRYFEGGETCVTLTPYGRETVGELEPGWYWCDVYGDVIGPESLHAVAVRTSRAAEKQQVG